MGRQRNETRFLQGSLQCWRAAVRPFVLHSTKCILGSLWLWWQISPSYPTSCHFELCLPLKLFSPKKRRAMAACTHRAFSSSTTPKPRQALIPQPYCGLMLWLQFTVQDGSSRQDKNKVKCSQGYIADLGKLLQLKLIWCGISLCHVSIMAVPGYRGMLHLELLDQHEGARNSLCACALRFLSSCFKFYKLFFWFVLVCPPQQIIMFVVPPKLWEWVLGSQRISLNRERVTCKKRREM